MKIIFGDLILDKSSIPEKQTKKTLNVVNLQNDGTIEQ